MPRRRKMGAIQKLGLIALVPIVAITSFVNWIETLSTKPRLSDADYQNLAFASIIALIIGTGVWYWIARFVKQRSAYRRALLAFQWDVNMSPLLFEQHCADYLKSLGWIAHTTTASGDQGCDVVAKKGRCTVVIQCKKYSKPVGNKAVQEIYAAKRYYAADISVVVSNQTYTKSAIDLARSASVHLLHFTDLRHLDRLCSAQFPELAP